MKGPGGVSYHSRNPHRQGVSADCERMKGKAESHQCCILCEGATMQIHQRQATCGKRSDLPHPARFSGRNVNHIFTHTVSREAAVDVGRIRTDLLHIFPVGNVQCLHLRGLMRFIVLEFHHTTVVMPGGMGECRSTPGRPARKEDSARWQTCSSYSGSGCTT